MISPMAPHFSSELWSRFISAPLAKNKDPTDINWSKSVLQQSWPEVDAAHELSVNVKVNCIDAVSYKFPRTQLDQLEHEEVLKRAMNDKTVMEMISNINLQSTRFELYPGCHGVLHIFLDQPIKVKKDKKNKKKAVQWIEWSKEENKALMQTKHGLDHLKHYFIPFIFMWVQQFYYNFRYLIILCL